MTNSTPLDSLRNRPPIEPLHEYHVDLLICSELHGEGPLRELFLRGWKNGAADFDGAWVSHRESEGESDVIAVFKSDSGKLVLFIENKIDAKFQPDQPQRYIQRAQRWKRAHPGIEVETVLFAPRDYFENEGSKIFDKQIGYEEAIEVLGQCPDRRTRFLAYALSSAIEKHKQGYKPQPPSETNTQVWDRIWEIAEHEVPRLRLEKPASKSRKSGFVRFNDAIGATYSDTQGRAIIIYKTRQGNVDLQFSKTQGATLLNSVNGELDQDMEVAQAGESASVRIKVPEVDPDKGPNEQEDAIRMGIQAAERLRLFFVEKRHLGIFPLD